MEYKTGCYFFIIFILFLPTDVFADSVNISVDLPIYTDMDRIAIHGNVSTETTLQIMITASDETIVLNEVITIVSGDFIHNITIGDYDLKRSGHYDISVIYDGIVVTDQFFYDSGHNVNPNKMNNGDSLSESDQIIIFTIAVIILISVLIFLARDSIFRKKTEYDANDWESKKNRDYEKYHSEWMSDEVKSGRREKTKFSDEEFRKSLLENDVPDYYAILEVNKTANQSEIKNQFRTLAKKWHPDKKQDEYAEKKMAQINIAYEVLSNTKQKEMYDLYYHKKQ